MILLLLLVLTWSSPGHCQAWTILANDWSDEILYSLTMSDPFPTLLAWDDFTQEFLAKHCSTDRCRFKGDLDSLNVFAESSPTLWSTMVRSNDVYVTSSWSNAKDPGVFPPTNIDSSLFVVNNEEKVTYEVFSNSLWEPGSSGNCKTAGQNEIKTTIQVACKGQNCDPHQVVVGEAFEQKTPKDLLNIDFCRDCGTGGLIWVGSASRPGSSTTT